MTDFQYSYPLFYINSNTENKYLSIDMQANQVIICIKPLFILKK